MNSNAAPARLLALAILHEGITIPCNQSITFELRSSLRDLRVGAVIPRAKQGLRPERIRACAAEGVPVPVSTQMPTDSHKNCPILSAVGTYTTEKRSQSFIFCEGSMPVTKQRSYQGDIDHLTLPATTSSGL
jgi:hypothetical protein